MTNAGLTDLPPEILDAIALQLPFDSALSLALTSAVLQPAGEKRLFRRINLTEFSDPTHERLPAPHDQLRAAQLIEVLRRRLTKHPWRSRSVRTLSINLRSGIPFSLRDTLELVSGGLETLSLHSVTNSESGGSPSRGSLSMPALLDWRYDTLPTLASITLDIPHDWGLTISRLFNAAPNLRDLTVHSVPLFPEQPSYSTVPPLASTKLERLVVDGLHLAMPAQLGALITASPELHTVILRDRRLKDMVPPEWTVVPSLAELPKLRSLSIPCYLQERVSRSGGFDSVEEMQVAWDYATIRERAEEGSPVMPRIPGLKRYQAEIIAYSPHWVYQNFLRPYQHSSAALMSIAFSLEREIHELPTLEIITIARSTPVTAPSELADEYDWRRQDFQGILVHHFESQGELGGKVDKLVVLSTRAQVGIMGHDRSPIYSGEELAFYNGRRLPVHVLCATFAAGAVQLKGLAPGLGELGEKGWAVLRYWEGRREMECSAGDA